MSLRGYAQRDPLVEYKLEGYQLFLEMTVSWVGGRSVGGWVGGWSVVGWGWVGGGTGCRLEGYQLLLEMAVRRGVRAWVGSGTCQSATTPLLAESTAPHMPLLAAIQADCAARLQPTAQPPGPNTTRAP